MKGIIEVHEMVQKIIAVDLGWGNLNGYDGVTDFVCPATFAERVDKLEAGHQLVCDFKKYLIGDPTTAYSRGMKKELLQHQLMMYLATANYVNNGDHVNLVVSCPVDIYLNKVARVSFKKFLNSKKEVNVNVDGLNKVARVSFKKFLNSKKEVNVNVDGIDKKFFIDKLEVMSEGAGIMYRHPEQFSDKTVGIIDIGAGTINFLYTNDLNIIRDQSFSEVIGIHHLRTNIRDVLRKNGIIVNEIEVDELLKNNQYYDIIAPVIDSYVNKIYKSINDRGWSKHVPIYFTGGGAMLLKDKIVDKFSNSTISETPLIDNVYGNYQIGVLLWSQM